MPKRSPGCNCCDDAASNFCCNNLSTIPENWIESLTLGQEGFHFGPGGVWSLVELVTTPIKVVPCDGYKMWLGVNVLRVFPCFTSNFDWEFGGVGTSLEGQWASTKFGPYDPLSVFDNIYQMQTDSDISFFYDTPPLTHIPQWWCDIPYGTTSPLHNSVRGPLAFKIFEAGGGAGTFLGTAPSGIPTLLSATTYEVYIGGIPGELHGEMEFRYPPVSSYCWPGGADCSWHAATLTSGEWVRSGYPTETQSGSSSWLYDSTYSFWYLNVPYTSSAGTGVWRLRDWAQPGYATTGTPGYGKVGVYHNSNSMPTDIFPIGSTCNGSISMTGSSGTGLSFTVSGGVGMTCSDGT